MSSLIEEYSQEAALGTCMEEVWDEVIGLHPEEGQKRNIAAKKRDVYQLFDSQREARKRYRVIFNPETASVRFEAGKVPTKSGDADLEQEFHRLADQWRNETFHLSLAREQADNLAYHQIIGMGEKALPFIFRELQETTSDWFWALKAITRADVEVRPEDRGNVHRIAEAWLEWGRENGHVARR
ncbi:MAG: hypothetical protein LC803_15560 [Acidobacteria bacterium]|nr:hypothetical protein [Acidobacteriota bacterium]